MKLPRFGRNTWGLIFIAPAVAFFLCVNIRWWTWARARS